MEDNRDNDWKQNNSDNGYGGNSINNVGMSVLLIQANYSIMW